MSFANRPHLTDRIKPLSPAKAKAIPWVGNGAQYKMHKQEMRGPRSHDNPLFLESSVDDDQRRDSRNVEELMLSSRSFSGHKENDRFQKHGRTKGSELRSPLSQASKLASAPVQASPKKILCEKTENHSVSRVEENKARCRRIQLFKAASGSSQSTIEFEGENMPRSFSTQVPPITSAGSLQFHPSSALVYSSSEIQSTAAARADELSPHSHFPKAFSPSYVSLSAESNLLRSEDGAADLNHQNARDRPRWQLDRIYIPISRVDSEDLDSADTSHLQTYERVTESPSSGTTPTSAFASSPVSFGFHQSESKHGASRSAVVEAEKSLLSKETTEKTGDEEKSTELVKVGEAGASVDEDDNEFEVPKGGSIFRGVMITVLLMGFVGYTFLAQNSPGLFPTMVHDKLLPSWQWKDIKFQASTMKIVKGCEGLWLTEPNPAQMAVDINQLQRNLKNLKERLNVTFRTITRHSSCYQWNTWHFFKSNMDNWKIGTSLWTKFLQNMAQKVWSQNQGQEDTLSSEAGKWDWFSEYDVFLEKHIFNTLPENEKEVIQKTLFSTNSPKSKALLFAINDEEKVMQADKSETVRLQEESSEIILPENTSLQALQEVMIGRSSSIEQKEFSSLMEIHSDERPIPMKEKHVQASSDFSLSKDNSNDNKQPGKKCEVSQQGVQNFQITTLRDQGSSDSLTEDQDNEKNVIASDEIFFTSANSKNKEILRNRYWWWLVLFLFPSIIALPILSRHLKLMINLREVRIDLPAVREAFIKLVKPNTVRAVTNRAFGSDYTLETGELNNKEELIMSTENFMDSPFGSFTAYKRVVSQKGSGNEQIKLTPVRRSNRIRHQAFSPSNRALKSPDS